MANEKHLEILKSGVDKWNKWRKENKDIAPDLTGANLTSADLPDVYLPDADLPDVYLPDVYLPDADLPDDLFDTYQTFAYLPDLYLPDADLSETNLTGANLTGANLSGANLSGVNLTKANLSKANLSKANLIEANLFRANLSEADLFRANLFGANLIEANLIEANLASANLFRADLFRSHLTGANLTGAGQVKANLSEANLSEANLFRANLSEADLFGANLSEANLFRANLFRANLSGADLSGADLLEAKINRTVFGLTDLSTCKGLETVKVGGTCTIDFQTLRASKNIPKSFLIKIGLPELFIDYLPDFFHDDGIRLYPVFLSHSWGNKDFAWKLYEALIGKGVNVFFDEKKMKPGDEIYKSISRGIDHYDKMILVCSEESLKSWWVDRELDRVLKKERSLYKEEGEHIDLLIPITIDDHVYKWDGPKAEEVQRYVIGDFKAWQDDDVFEKALSDLIHALNVDRLEIKPESYLKKKPKS